MESALYRIFTLVGFVSEISLARCAHSFDLDTSPTRVKIPYARAFHEVISMFKITRNDVMKSKMHGGAQERKTGDNHILTCLTERYKYLYFLKKVTRVEVRLL